ncbi:hypothetical protein BDV95DRAFT_579168 [Massariosphaeria phaeospora]|uniref:Uncharacterized protein n=1 Tax=Massariosphaeria phaeospora TaxID=100035 RepID=A0A7C8M593_9PLEO|nr:hypothetical protein BDV95DRAFT_579168 [Massariosphaeria phaeospora]
MLPARFLSRTTPKPHLENSNASNSRPYPASHTPNCTRRTLVQSSVIRSPSQQNPPSKPSPSGFDNPSPPTLSFFALVKESSRPVRYTVYAGLGLMATAETTFWTNVIYAKYFAPDDEKEKSEEFLANAWAFIDGYRRRWIPNYQKYYSSHLWGL